MKEVLIVRHANWDFVTDKLTDEGRAKCVQLRPQLGSFAMSYSSPFIRAQETAELVSGAKPVVDERAGILASPPEYGARIGELRKTHPLGVAGALISIPELHEPLRQQGAALKELVQEALEGLEDGQQALVVSHDGTMVALEKILKDESFDDIDHSFGELEGFRVGEDMKPVTL